MEQTKPNSSVICTDPAAELMALKDGRAEGKPDLITELQVLLYKMYLAGCRSGIDGNKTADEFIKNLKADVKVAEETG